MRTDHASLLWLVNFGNKTNASGGMYQRWPFELGEYNYSITHRKGSEHSNADGLSRIHKGHGALTAKRLCPYPDCRECKVERMRNRKARGEESEDSDDSGDDGDDENTDGSMDERARSAGELAVTRSRQNLHGPRDVNPKGNRQG